MSSLAFTIDADVGVLALQPIGCSLGRSVPERLVRQMLGQYRTLDRYYQTDKQKRREIHYRFKARDDTGLWFDVLLVYEGIPNEYQPLLRCAWLTQDSPESSTDNFFEKFDSHVMQHNQWMATRFGDDSKAEFKWGTIESINNLKVEHGGIVITWHNPAE